MIKKKGFTLIEILFAIMILTISIIPAMMLLPRIFKDNTTIALTNRAVFLGQMKMEQVKTKALTFYDSNYSVTGPLDPKYIAFVAPDDMYKYTVSDDLGPDIKTLIVTIWYDKNNNNARDGSEEWVEYKTKIANRGA
jgi:prepilin-type N-terminal cleavage/methylation domain-containing protein